jgi:hypothetical protein
VSPRQPTRVRLCGPFAPDPDLPADHQGRHACRHCHLVGQPGDAHHTMPPAPEQDVRGLAAGEREESAET